MKIYSREINKIYKKSAKRVGRGISAGGGKTAGRGTKGQKARAGYNLPKQFEGGQTNLSMRLPKLKGFSGIRRKTALISLDLLSKNFVDGDTVSEEKIIKLKLAKTGDRIKIVANGTLDKKLTIDNVRISETARKMIDSVAAKAPEKKEKVKSATEKKPKTAAKKSDDDKK